MSYRHLGQDMVESARGGAWRRSFGQARYAPIRAVPVPFRGLGVDGHAKMPTPLLMYGKGGPVRTVSYGKGGPLRAWLERIGLVSPTDQPRGALGGLFGGYRWWSYPLRRGSGKRYPGPTYVLMGDDVMPAPMQPLSVTAVVGWGLVVTAAAGVFWAVSSGWGIKRNRSRSAARRRVRRNAKRERKTVDVFDIEGNYGYGHGYEVVTAETSRSEALARLREYRENEPGIAFRVVKRRERKS